MQAHIISLHKPSTPGKGSKVKIFVLLKVVMMYIKIREWNIEHQASTYSILTHTRTLGYWDRVKKVKKSEIRVAYLIRREWSTEHHETTYSIIARPLAPWVGSKHFSERRHHAK